MFDLQERLESDLVVSGLQLCNSGTGSISRNMESEHLQAHIGAKVSAWSAVPDLI